MGTLEKFDVMMIGATADAIDKAEDRELFRNAMTKIGLPTPRSHQIKTWRRRSRRWKTSACPRSSARRSRSAAPAAASPITRPNLSTSSKAASTPPPPAKC